MNVLVTGGAGFIGSHLVDRLVEEGHQVTVLDDFSTGSRANLSAVLDKITLAQIDVANLPHLVDEDDDPPTRIFHLACPASPVAYQRNPVATIRTAVLGTLRVLDLARKTGARVLLASTSEVYGDPLVHPQTEDYWGNVNPVGGRSCYDEGKRAAEAASAAYARQYGVECRIARIFNTYGPRLALEDGRVVSNFILRALLEQPLEIYGNGAQTRSLAYVSDTIDGLVRLMESEESRPVNLGNPEEVTVWQLAQAILRLTGSRSDVVHRPAAEDDPRQRRPDIARAKALGWAPQITLEEGLKKTIDDFKKRLG